MAITDAKLMTSICWLFKALYSGNYKKMYKVENAILRLSMEDIFFDQHTQSLKK